MHPFATSHDSVPPPLTFSGSQHDVNLWIIMQIFEWTKTGTLLVDTVDTYNDIVRARTYPGKARQQSCRAWIPIQKASGRSRQYHGKGAILDGVDWIDLSPPSLELKSKVRTRLVRRFSTSAGVCMKRNETNAWQRLSNV